MIEEDFETTLKVIVVGNGKVGKTSMITRFAKGVFTDDYKKTLAVDFLEKRTTLKSTGEEITFLLWDTAGQEEYDAVTRAYYKGAGAAIVSFSTNDRNSFDAVERWHNKVAEECGPIAMALVQNKVDLLDQAEMSAGEVEGLARKLSLKLYRTCVKDNLNVSEVFEYLGDEFLRRGGEAALQQKQITDIKELASTAPPASSGTSSGASPQAAAGGDANPSFTPGGVPSSASSPSAPISLHKKPKVQRTGGKKSRFPFNCSVA
ncbi:unnamed protein product [Vitrella brassicaformis CCMP3155]|uniref:Ras-related protein Rab-23 n=2 Tax=Vitrella brassicaformis TaxID=1169539 RepID=A0A0G4FHC7_VITBC|nr:unnamed protein product [Vitrella brassicaformis CCMP3155]|mmetsp:Transcript_13394/g.31972  ORF Transcript_13394/g.31972 Transcript_13394/m.31972 type:complete len:262 (+) Transcript_13394:176-961(+)|eukprot:CEM12335.1 unnamed protein product [Vitrella brassicaformis CCMP3155]